MSARRGLEQCDRHTQSSVISTTVSDASPLHPAFQTSGSTNNIPLHLHSPPQCLRCPIKDTNRWRRITQQDIKSGRWQTANKQKKSVPHTEYKLGEVTFASKVFARCTTIAALMPWFPTSRTTSIPLCRIWRILEKFSLKVEGKYVSFGILRNVQPQGSF